MWSPGSGAAPAGDEEEEEEEEEERQAAAAVAARAARCEESADERRDVARAVERVSINIFLRISTGKSSALERSNHRHQLPTHPPL
jgi:hypothetical protein